MKRIYLLLVLSIISLQSLAYRFSAVRETGQTLYYDILYDGTISVTCENANPWSGAYNKYPTGDLIIPEMVEYDGVKYMVTNIGVGAFMNCSRLTSIVLPQTISSISESAFYGCTKLISINIPDGVEAISQYVFNECSSLTSIALPESIRSIGNVAFFGCSKLTSIVIPENVTSIGLYAFSGCSSLTSINLPNALTVIPIEAFNGCSSLTSISIPETVTVIDKAAFCGCTSLTTINIPKGIEEISNELFYGCSKLANVEIPENVKEIGDYAFYGCSSLTTINIPKGIEEISYALFSGCSKLANVEIPENVKEIGERSFEECSSLTSITIPDGIEKIPTGAFLYCSSLTNVVLPTSVTEIGPYSFAYCNSLTSLKLSDGLTSIGEAAFKSCHNLTTINLPKNITDLGQYVFVDCMNLTSVDIPEGIEQIPTGAFKECSSLTNVVLPTSVTEIGPYSFAYCNSLTSLKLSDGLTSIGEAAFYYCVKLTNVTLPESVTSFGTEAFGYCSNLTTINLPKNITDLGQSVFMGCMNLTSVDIPEGIEQIPFRTFDGCMNLTNVTLPESVESIALEAFFACNIQSCIIKSQTPPEGTGSLCTAAVVYVPCGYLAAYLADENWNIYNLVETNYKVELLSSNKALGTVSYEGSLCAADGKLNLVATPISISQFVAWSDGNTENPRTVVIDKDTVFTAIFGDKPIITVTNTRMPVCDAYNGSITVSVSSGVEPYSYEWSDGGPAEESRSGLQSGIYTLKVTDAIGRFDELEINLESGQSYKAQIYPTVVNPICETKNGSITLSVSGGTAPYTYKWSDSETTELSRSGLASGEYIFTVTDNAGCISEKKIELVKNEDNMPVIADKVTNAVCGQNIGEIELSISGGAEPYTYVWKDGKTELHRSNLMPKTYSFSVSDAYGCITKYEKEIIAETFKQQPEIAMVSVSQEVEAANLVVWQKEQTEAIYYYTIYRETEKSNDYKPVVMIPYTETSIFVDENTNNMQQAYKYKISATDLCGQESPLSDYHKTIHLTKGVSLGSAINLIWDGYEGFEFDTYSVYRVTTTGVEEITKVSSQAWTYTDLKPVEGTLSYYVAVELPNIVDVNDPQMKAEGGPFVITISNIAEAENGTAIAEFADNNYMVYANQNTIIVENAGYQKVIVCEATGKKVFEGIASEIPVKTVGVYIVIVGNKSYKVVVK
ncbi:MAG: leucine-rich repeat protein [Bacteroidales bacterium]|nr:leucine-rich repeat protein [Bacteroidales bacterium]